MCRIKSITRELQQSKTTSESNPKSKPKIAGNLSAKTGWGQQDSEQLRTNTGEKNKACIDK